MRLRHRSIVLTNRRLEVAAEDKNDILKIPAPPHSWQKPYKYAIWNIQQVCLTLRGQDTQTP